MEKKHIVGVIILLSIVLNIKLYSDLQIRGEAFRNISASLNETIYRQEESLSEKNYDISDYETQTAGLENDLEAYRILIRKIIDGYKNDQSELVNSVYEYDLYYILDKEQLKVPINGRIFIEEAAVTVGISVIKPPYLEDDSINFVFHNNNITPISREIYYPIPEEIQSSDNHMILTYENIEVDEEIILDPMPLLERTFGLEYDEIIITRMDASSYPLGTDYFPNQPMEVVLDTEQTLYYDYVDEMLRMKFVHEEEEGFVMYELNESIVMVGTDSSPVPLSEVILPERIIEGLSWHSLNFDYVIKEVNHEMMVDGKTYSCVVVEEYHEGDTTGLLYYGKGVGIIKKHGYYGGSFEALNIKNSQ